MINWLLNVIFPSRSQNEIRSRRAVTQQQISHIDPLGDAEFNRRRAEAMAMKAKKPRQ